MPRKGPHRYGPYERAHKHETAARMAARRLMIRKLGKKAVEGKHVDHVKSIKKYPHLARDPKNLRLRDPKKNMGDKTYD